MPLRLLRLAALLAAAFSCATFVYGADLSKMRTPVAPQGPGWVKLDVPYVPTPPAVVDAMLKIANVGPDDIVYDLGSGDGRIPIAAVRQNNAKQAVGIELNPNRVAEAVATTRNLGLEGRVSFIQGDVFKTDFSAATVVTMYLLDNVNLRLRPRILDELKPGTRIVSHQFHMLDWTPDDTVLVDTVPVHFWVVPAKLEGRWSGDGVSLHLKQQFQTASGTLEAGGTAVKIGRALIKGSALSFDTTLERNGASTAMHFHATAAGDVLTGTLKQGGVNKDIALKRGN
jgi:SAM-dependent methyltransferase